MDLSPLQKISQLTKQDDGETLRDVGLIYPFPIITGGLYRALIFPKKVDSVWIISVNSPRQRRWHRHVCDVLLKQVVFLTVNHCGPLPLKELHSTDDKRSSVERPWGILSPFSTHFRLQVNSPFQGLFVTQTYYYVASLWSRSFFLRWITADPSPWGNFTPPTKL